MQQTLEENQCCSSQIATKPNENVNVLIQKWRLTRNHSPKRHRNPEVVEEQNLDVASVNVNGNGERNGGKINCRGHKELIVILDF